MVKVHAEHSILVNSDFKSVRLDIYASDEMQVNYNLEAQNEKERESCKAEPLLSGRNGCVILKEEWKEKQKV